jgi:hypothetical protein
MTAVGPVLGVTHPHPERTGAEVDGGDLLGDELGAEALGLARKFIISSGPMMPSGKPGKFSTSVVSISWPPGWSLVDEGSPSMTERLEVGPIRRCRWRR